MPSEPTDYDKDRAHLMRMLRAMPGERGRALTEAVERVLLVAESEAERLRAALATEKRERMDYEGRLFAQSLAAVAELEFLLALHSGGKAGRVPDGWDLDVDRFVRRHPKLVCRVGADGTLIAWRRLGDGQLVIPGRISEGPRPILAAIAEAADWVKMQGGPP